MDNRSKQHGKNICPDCGSPLWYWPATQFYRCLGCKGRYRLVRTENGPQLRRLALLDAGVRLIVQHQPMPIDELAHRLGVKTIDLHRRCRKGNGFYYYDNRVYIGTRPSWL